MEKREFILGVQPLTEEEYASVDNDRLILRAIALLEKSGVEAVFDNVVVLSYRLFPARFSLIGFPEYPDAKRVHDCLWHCVYKTKKWLAGNPKSGYRLTEKGTLVLERTRWSSSNEGEAVRPSHGKAHRKQAFFVSSLKGSSAFRKYLKGQGKIITELELREALRGRWDTSKTTIRQNYGRYLDYARDLEDSDALGFLTEMRRDWPQLLGGE